MRVDCNRCRGGVARLRGHIAGRAKVVGGKSDRRHDRNASKEPLRGLACASPSIGWPADRGLRLHSPSSRRLFSRGVLVANDAKLRTTGPRGPVPEDVVELGHSEPDNPRAEAVCRQTPLGEPAMEGLSRDTEPHGGICDGHKERHAVPGVVRGRSRKARAKLGDLSAEVIDLRP